MSWPPRYTILLLLFLLSLVNYIDRVNISITAPVMMPELGWDTTWFGVVFSAFVAGYAAFMIPSGLLADTRSPKMLLAGACFGWSFFTLLTPLGQHSSLLMLTLRFLVGAFEATSLPAATVINARWVPKHELGIAQMISLSGIYAGQLIAYPISTWIIKNYSWRSVFYFNAVAGFLWIALWLWKGADHPKESQAVDHEEKMDKVKVPIGTLLGTPAVLALALAYFFWAYGLSMVVAWLPTYLVKARAFTLQEMGWVGMLPVTGGLIGVLGGGALSDWLTQRGINKAWSRKGIPAILIACSAPFLAVAAVLSSPMHAVFALAVFQLLTTLGLVAFWSIPVEMNRRLAGSIASIMNFGGNFGGFFSPMVAGYIVTQTNDWSLPFYTAAAGCLLGAIILGFCVPVRTIEFLADPIAGKTPHPSASAG
jgi:ACS family glucarate transporter-like MFS transporter